MDEVRAGREEVQKLTARMAGMSVSVKQLRSSTPERRQPHRSLQETNATPSMQRAGDPPSYDRGGRTFREQSRSYNSGTGRQFFRPGTGMRSNPCDRCGRFHAHKICPALSAACFNCGHVGHFRAKCRGVKRGAMNISE